MDVAAAILRAVAATPDAVALESSEQRLPYAALLRRGDAVAAALAEAGTKPGDRVAVACDRGAGRVIAIVGTVLAGATYVPIDPSQPPARIAEIAADAEIAATIADRRGFGSGAHRPLVALEDTGECPPPTTRPSRGPEDLTYVIFTSGSSGRPKGVEICDRGVLVLSAAVDELARRHGVSGVLQFSSHTFDASVWEIFPALLSGRSLWLPEGDPSRLQPEQLIAAAVRGGVDMATLPPSYLMAADPAAVESMPALTIVAGEPCPPALVRRWASRTALHNAYGPTEITVAATIARLSEDDAAEVPIGTPLAHVETEVLVDGLPVAGTAVGELFLGGPSLARGYLGDPVQTAERFREVETRRGRRRMYATGDLVRHRADGQLVFVERADRQVKVRGYRVELGDVEAALLAVPGVEQAVAFAVGDDGLLDRLVAFVSGSADPAAARAEVARTRPAYMVPAEVRSVAEWPVNRSGKIDHGALRESLARSAAEDGRASPATDPGEVLARRWRELLEVAAIDDDSEFFDLGGHSMLVINLVAAVREDLGVRITTRDLYENPRFGDFRKAVESATRAPA
jgi:amino acid adenylation domain-containing protein